MLRSPIALRQVAAAAFAIAVLAAATAQGRASIRDNVAVKAATEAANQFVAKIGPQSCSDFAATMAQMKSKSASPSPMSAKLKANTDARTAFVNIAAAPLLNKLIDCNILPGGT